MLSLAAFQPGPRPIGSGYRASSWTEGQRIWSGRLRVVELDGDRAEIRLENTGPALEAHGAIFAVCPIPDPAKTWLYCEPVVDSSRYFVVRVEDASSGRHAFLGLGFEERHEASAFCAALADYVARAKRAHEARAAALAPAPGLGGVSADLLGVSADALPEFSGGTPQKITMDLSNVSLGGHRRGGSGFGSGGSGSLLVPLPPPPPPAGLTPGPETKTGGSQGVDDAEDIMGGGAGGGGAEAPSEEDWAQFGAL